MMRCVAAVKSRNCGRPHFAIDAATVVAGDRAMIHVVATIEVAAGQRPAFLNIFRALVPRVRAEAGCVDYGPTVDVATDISGLPAVRENEVTVVEKWADVAALKAHLATPHMQAFLAQTQPLVKGIDIRVLQPV
jgi:quinol monooxygenase YgiN